MECFECLADIPRSGLLELFDANVAHFLWQEVGCDAFDPNDGADDFHAFGFGKAFALDPDDDFGAGFSAQFADGFVEGHVDGGFIADPHDAVHWFEAHSACWCARHGTQDGQKAIFVLDHNAESTKLSFCVEIHFLVVRGRKEAGVLVQCTEYPVDGRKFDFTEFDVTAIMLFDEGKDRPQLKGYAKDDGKAF